MERRGLKLFVVAKCFDFNAQLVHIACDGFPYLSKESLLFWRREIENCSQEDAFGGEAPEKTKLRAKTKTYILLSGSGWWRIKQKKSGVKRVDTEILIDHYENPRCL